MKVDDFNNFELSPEAKKNLVDFFIALLEIQQEINLQERLDSYSLGDFDE